MEDDYYVIECKKLRKKIFGQFRISTVHKLLHGAQEKNSFFSQLTATPSSPTSLKETFRVSMQNECTVTPIGW